MDYRERLYFGHSWTNISYMLVSPLLHFFLAHVCMYVSLCMFMLDALLVTLCNPLYYNNGFIVGSIDMGQLKSMHEYMLSEEEIHEWRNQKIKKYLKNYIR